MKIVDMVCSGGLTGFFFDDQKAIKAGALADGNTYVGDPLTPGFRQIRQAGESISVMLILDDGQVAHGDCAAVQYSGAGGRDPLFLARDFLPVLEREVKPRLAGREVTGFRALAEEMDSLLIDGRKMHTALRYGLSQAILDAAAKAGGRLMAEAAADEYGLTVSDRPIPIFCQTGDDRYLGADKIILKGADVLPHALINNVPGKLGHQGEKLKQYIQWLRARIESLRPYPEYRPVMHIDVYGTLSLIFNDDLVRVADYLADLEETARPFHLRIEGPVDLGQREKQIRALSEIGELLARKGAAVEVVADEWCNTLEDVRDFADQKAGHMIQIKTPDLGSIHNSIEAVMYCRSRGIKAYLGGTCNETERSAQVCAHAAMASSPDQCLAKPGMGVDEGYMIVHNEMRRIVALRQAREARWTP